MRRQELSLAPANRFTSSLRGHSRPRRLRTNLAIRGGLELTPPVEEHWQGLCPVVYLSLILGWSSTSTSVTLITVDRDVMAQQTFFYGGGNADATTNAARIGPIEV